MGEKFIFESILIFNADLTEKELDECVKLTLDRLYEQPDNRRGVYFSEWGKKKLAYSIDHHQFGYYVQVYHEDSEEGIQRVHNIWDCQKSFILKYISVRRDDCDWPDQDPNMIPYRVKTGVHSEQTTEPDLFDVLFGLAVYE